MSVSEKFEWRVMELWNEPDGEILFSDAENFVKTKDMINTDSPSKLTEFVKYIKSLGFNGLSIVGDPDLFPEAAKRFSIYLKEKGIGLIIFRSWNEYDRGGKSWPGHVGGYRILNKSKKYCPFNPEVKEYWKNRFAKDFKMIPDLIGYHMIAAEYYTIVGAPWMCDCKKCQNVTKKDRARTGIKLIADLLKPYNATLFWSIDQNDPWGMSLEVELYSELTGLLPENVKILVKETYYDYQPENPRHPLFDKINTDEKGRSPYITCFQLPGEYRGVHSAPYAMVDKWSKTFKDIARTGQSGIWVMAMVHPTNYDHPLNLVNWYALSRYIKNPYEDPDRIMQDWAVVEFGEKTAPVLVKIVKKVTEANKNILYFKGLWTQNHSKFFDLAYLESHVCGPSRLTKAIDGMMGLELPLDMYSPEKAKKVKKDDRTLAEFNRIPITEKLKKEIIMGKKKAIILIDECMLLLKSIEDSINKDIFEDLLGRLESNKNDAIFWKEGMEIYLDWKLSKLTETKIDKALERCKDLKGAMMPEPLNDKPKLESWVNMFPSTLLTFANELKAELKEPKLKDFLKNNPDVGAGDIDITESNYYIK